MEKRNKKNIPHFSSLDEEACYWEKHSIAPYWDNLEDADISLKGATSDNWLLIRLDSKSIGRLHQLAHKKHQTIQKLAKQWVESLAS